MHDEDKIKIQELNDARLLVEDATEQLRSEANDFLFFFLYFFLLKVVFVLLYVTYEFSHQEFLRVLMVSQGN